MDTILVQQIEGVVSCQLGLGVRDTSHSGNLRFHFIKELSRRGLASISSSLLFHGYVELIFLPPPPRPRWCGVIFALLHKYAYKTNEVHFWRPAIDGSSLLLPSLFLHK